MNKKSKKTLKNAFNIPEPKRKEEFFNSLPTKQKKSFSFNIPLYISTAVTAVVIIGIWSGIKNLPYFEQPDNIDTPVYSESTSLKNHKEKTSVQTTTVSSAEKNTENTTVTSSVSKVKTSGISTVSGTQNTETTVSVQTTTKNETVRTETTATTKESNNISYKPTTEIHTTEITSAPETESPETTTKTTASTRTTTKTTVKTTTATRTTTKTTLRTTTKTTTIPQTTTTTTTTKFHENIFPVTTTIAESEINHVTTTTFNGGTPGVAVDVTTQTMVASVDIPPQTTTTKTDDNGMCTEPPRDFTVIPAVQYYPDGEIYITDSESTDVIRPPTSQDYGTEMFREMAENSDLIAIVAVDEIIYTGFDGKPYTQENAIVTDVIYGNIPVNSRISIYCTGGYIPASEYSTDKHIDIEELIENNVTVLDYAGNNNFSQVGDSYICFLKKSDGTFPDGSYYLTGLNNISKFAFSGDNYVNLNNHQYLTLNEIQSFLNK